MGTRDYFATLLHRAGRHLRRDVLPTIALLLSLALGISLVATLIPDPEFSGNRSAAGELAFSGLQLRSLRERP